MCLAAMRMAGVTRAVYAYSNADAEPYGLSTASIALALRADPHEQTGFSFTQQNRKVSHHCMISGSKTELIIVATDAAGFRQPVFLIPYPPVSSAGFVFLPSVFSALFYIPLIYPLNMLLFVCSAPSVCQSFRLFYFP